MHKYNVSVTQAKRFQKKATWLYIAALSVIGILAISSQGAIQYFFSQQEHDSHIINVAGRQRMLSQKLTKHALLLAYAKNAQAKERERQALQAAFSLWKKAHDGLQQGDAELSLPVPELSKKTLALFDEIAPHQAAMEIGIEQLLSADTAAYATALKSIQKHEAPFLVLMNDITNQFDAEAQARVQRLKKIEVFLLIFTLLALFIEALFVFRPFIVKLNANTKVLLLANRELQQKQSEILSQSEELQQQNEEVLIIQEQLESYLVELERQHEAIKASIRYARTIQEAVLPHIPRIKASFKDAFVVYKPQNIVSGDFFWFKAFEEKRILVVGDCTGHGVPGAFMSLLGMSFLDFIIAEEKSSNPDAILEQMNFLVIKNLKQTKTDNQDGMELILCQLEGNTLKFAASKRPLYIVPSKEKLQTYKGTRRYIGITKALQEASFKVHELQLEPNTMLYLTSDGLQDQPNPKRKRFGSKKLKRMLQEIAEKPATVQKNLLEEAFEAHKQEAWQVDDVTVLGVRV